VLDASALAHDLSLLVPPSRLIRLFGRFPALASARPSPPSLRLSSLDEVPPQISGLRPVDVIVPEPGMRSARAAALFPSLLPSLHSPSQGRALFLRTC